MDADKSRLSYPNFFLLQVLDTLQEIQERHDAVKEIEKKLLDLQQVRNDQSPNIKLSRTSYFYQKY
jgi:hypothetical protein